MTFIMKKTIASALLLAVGMTAGAQTNKTGKWFQDIKFSGYFMGQYSASDQKDQEQNSFNTRLIRTSLEGRALDDFYWKVQLQLNGQASSNSMRIVDVFGEWQKYDFLYIKAGQFKRCFTFENPMHPITQGFYSYSQNVSRLAGFNDIIGGESSNGRDIGIQLQGDLLKTRKGRALLHYQVGLYNGQGINVKDKNNRKDLIGGLWVMPVKGMRIGAFGWTGSYGLTDASTGEVVSLDKNRYALSGEYVADDWTFRTEYIHHTGYKNVQKTGCNKADGYYALLIAPVIKQKFHLKARYDTFRSEATWTTSKTFYELGADYNFNKHLQLSAEYAYVYDRNLADNQGYNMVDVQMNIRF